MEKRSARWRRWWSTGLALGLALGLAAEAGAQGGRLLLRGPDTARDAAPTLATEVEMRVVGPLARTRVVQRFRNPGDVWVEALYELPLPETAAVDALRMVVGRRVVEGRIRERAQARAEYREAKAVGRRASMVEQRRPDIFTTALANVGPGEEIEVELEYQHTVDFRNGRFRLRLPLTVAPRYRDDAPSAAASATGAIPASSPDGAGPRDHARAAAPVRIRVELDAGVELRELGSASHAVHVRRGTGHRYEVELDGAVAADRDFTLEWEPETGPGPLPLLWVEPRGAHLYGLLMVLPPRSPDPGHRLDREIVFVIDTSGSMNGASIEQARRALLWALGRLDGRDRFNVIAFDSEHRPLFPEPVAASDANRDTARRWVEALRAGGGTEMRGALAAALDDRGAPVDLRQVVFVTDGAVGYERELFAAIDGNLGRSRLFTVGIGSAPNGHFLRTAARWGRGTFTTVQHLDEVESRMGSLFARLERPVLRDLELHWSDPGVEAWPRPVPDLYWGEPLVVAARLPALGGRLGVEGWQGEVPWRVELAVEADGFASGLHRLWARRKVEGLLDGRVQGADPEGVRARVLELGLHHDLVTPYTSLVAVDATPVAPPGAIEIHRVPSLLPAGWEGAVLPRTATPAPLLQLLGLGALAAGLAVRRAVRIHPGHGASGGRGRP